jgi:DegV family protein with EDD domain
MDQRIVVDSCCDVTPELCRELNITSVPLTITLGDRSITDDENIDLPQFMEDMKNCKSRIGSAAPAPALFKDAFMEAPISYAVTLSSNLSGSYASAMLGRELACEEGADVHVFDSKSAAAGEVLIALKTGEMIKAGIQKSEIIRSIEGFIKQMKTYFVLENIDNLLKNGRISKIKGTLITVLGIKPIMSDDGDGNIALYSHARGENQIIERLTDTIKRSDRSFEGQSLVIAHCNNPGLADRLMNEIKKRFPFREIHIVPTRGISSMYANMKGLIMAF